MIKSITVDHQLGYGQMNDVYGGQDIRITVNPELAQMLQWWKEWDQFSLMVVQLCRTH